MQTYEILVKDRAIRPNSKDMTLVRTSIGIDQLHVLFDNSEWLDFPITITFAQGEDIISQSLQVTAVADSEWVAEGTVTIPHEVIDMLGPIRVTLQGTDANGRHIITAKGSPLSVEEAGDVIQGIEPSDNPTMDEWYQAYANAVAAANAAASLVANLQAQLDNMVSDAEAEIDAKVGESYRPATRTELGAIMVGDGLSITDDGVLSANAGQGGQSIDVSDLYGLADTAFDNPFETPVVKPDVLPIATMDNLGAIYPDGTSVTIDQDGMIHAVAAYVPTATTDVTGIVKPDGTTLTIDADGTLHGADQTPIATNDTVGKVKPDGTTLTIEEDGTLHGVEQTPIATAMVAGKVKPDGTTLTIDADGTLHGNDLSKSNIIYIGETYPSRVPIDDKYCYSIFTTKNIDMVDGTTLIVRFLGRLEDVYSKVYITINGGEPYELLYYNSEPVRWPIITLGVSTIIVYNNGAWRVVGEFDNPANQVISCVSDSNAGDNYKYVDTYITEIRAGIMMILTLNKTNTASLSDLRIMVRGYNWDVDHTTAYIRKNGQALTENLIAGVQYVLRFDGTYWQLIGTIGDTRIATTSEVGTVKPDGTTITIDNDGTLHGVEQTPIATTKIAGKVKPDGTSITIDGDGTIHGRTSSKIYYGYRMTYDIYKRCFMVDTDDSFVLEEGVSLIVRNNEEVRSSAYATISVNAGDEEFVGEHGSYVTSSNIRQGARLLLTYSGSYWDLICDLEKYNEIRAGISVSPAESEDKVASIIVSNEIFDGFTVMVTFANENSAPLEDLTLCLKSVEDVNVYRGYIVRNGKPLTTNIEPSVPHMFTYRKVAGYAYWELVGSMTPNNLTESEIAELTPFGDIIPYTDSEGY